MGKLLVLFELIFFGKSTRARGRHRMRFMWWVKHLKVRNALFLWQKRRLFGSDNFMTKPFLLEELRHKEFIFIISFHRTGTRSVDLYLEKIGFRGIHWPSFVNTGIDYEYILNPIVDSPSQCINALAPLFAEYDCFSDVPFPGLFRELAETFPKGKFILVQRSPDEWWNSVRRHWHLKEHSYYLSEFEAIQYKLPVNTVIKDNDKEFLVDKYTAHIKSVQEYFSGTGRLLFADLNDLHLNEKISNFVGISQVPPFPHIVGRNPG